MCEFHGSNGNGFGDIWWTDNPIYFSSIDVLHSEYYTFTKHKINSHGSQKLSFLTETEMACGNAL